MDLSIIEQAKDIEIKNAEGYLLAVELWQLLTNLEKEIASEYDTQKKMAWALHGEIISKEKKRISPVKSARVYVKSKMDVYNQEIERKRVEAQMAINKEEKRKEEERIMAEAEAAFDAGYEELSDRILSSPVSAPLLELPSEIQKIKGLSWREIWKFRIIDASLVPKEYKIEIIDEKKVDHDVKRMKGATNIPGIMVYSERV